jgi:hypothetical protein
MDKTMFTGFVRQLVREAVEEELKRQIPKLIKEAVAGMTTSDRLTEVSTPARGVKPKPSRAELAGMLGLERLGNDTIVASTRNMVTELPSHVNPSDPNVQAAVGAINKDYSALMKKLL